jgi:hypothetical protein
LIPASRGRLLTTWSAAGILGPVLVNYIRQFQIDSGVPKAQAYSVTMYIMADGQQSNSANRSDTPAAQIVAVWAIVLIPLSWGFVETVIEATQLFN